MAEKPRTIVLIDGSNLYAASRSLGVDVDYRKLSKFLNEKYDVIRVSYYSALLESEEFTPLKPLTDWLAYNGYNLVTKPAKEFTDSTGRRRVKGNMDIEIAVDMMELVHAPNARIEHVVLFSGDADFRRLLESVQRMGVRTTVVSSIKTVPPMVADELRRQTDVFVDLNDIISNFTREERTDRPARTGEAVVMRR